LESSSSDSLHGHGRESVGQHSTDQETSEQQSISDLDLINDQNLASFFFGGRVGGSGDESTVEGEGDESSRTNGETFTDSSGSVTSSIQSVSSVSSFFTEFTHFSNTTGIIRDGAISIDSQTNSQVGEHTKGSESNTEKTEEDVGDVSSDGQEDDGVDGGEVTKGKTVDNVGGSTSLAGFSDFFNGSVVVRGIIFSQETNSKTNNESRSTANEAIGGGQGVIFEFFGGFSSTFIRKDDGVIVLGANSLLAVTGSGNSQESRQPEGDEKQDSGDDELVSEGSFNLLVFVDLHDMGSEDGANQASNESQSAEHKGVHKVNISIFTEISGGVTSFLSALEASSVISLVVGFSQDDQTSASSFSERTEEIRAHTSNITDVVTDVISNGSGVLGGIFREILFNFTDEISTDISSLGVDTTTDSSKKSHGGTTQTVTSNSFIKSGTFIITEGRIVQGERGEVDGESDLSVDHDQGDENQESKGGEGETHDATSLESNSETFSQGGSREFLRNGRTKGPY